MGFAGRQHTSFHVIAICVDLFVKLLLIVFINIYYVNRYDIKVYKQMFWRGFAWDMKRGVLAPCKTHYLWLVFSAIKPIISGVIKSLKNKVTWYVLEHPLSHLDLLWIQEDLAAYSHLFSNVPRLNWEGGGMSSLSSFMVEELWAPVQLHHQKNSYNLLNIFQIFMSAWISFTIFV